MAAWLDPSQETGLIAELGELLERAGLSHRSDVKAILKALREATSELERKFSSSTGGDAQTFKLKE